MSNYTFESFCKDYQLDPRSDKAREIYDGYLMDPSFSPPASGLVSFADLSKVNSSTIRRLKSIINKPI